MIPILIIQLVLIIGLGFLLFWQRRSFLYRTNDLQHWKEIKANKDQILAEREKEIEQCYYQLEKVNNNLKEQEAIYNQQIGSMKEKLNKEYENYRIEQEKVLTDTVNDFVEHFRETSKSKVTAAQELSQHVSQLKATVASAIEIAKHRLEEQQQKDFYRLQLSEEDIEDVARLREIERNLHNAEPLNKVIWKVYYEKPYTDLIGRVIGANKVYTGIYKITNINTEQVYIGQAVNIAERWRQHIKRGVGAETPTQNKLYPAMKKIGPENFTFEVVELCDRAKLDQREDYWQSFYGAKEFGYSIK